MSNRVKFSCVILLAMLAGTFGLAGFGADEPDKKPEAAAADAPAVAPKPLSDIAKKGLAYLVNQQHEDGGWGQGGGWRPADKGGGRVEGATMQDPSDVANTCIATLALLRAGNTPKDGEYAKNVAKAFDFIFNKVDKADKESLYVTDVRNTQVQVKIGPYVDTFLTALVLAELKGKMQDEQGEKRLIAALDKTVNKIEINQKPDGTYANNTGWASVISQGLASKALNRAAQSGAKVSKETLDRDNKQAVSGLDKKPVEKKPAESPRVPHSPGPGMSGIGGLAIPALRFEADPTAPPTAPTAPSDAGVPLYSSGSSVAASQEIVNTLKQDEKKNRDIVNSATASPAAKQAAQKDLDRLKQAEADNSAAVQGLTAKLGDGRFVQGFGSNGGEEFLSYMNISETLLVKGGAEWEKWDKSMTENLGKIQDKDGGWSGQHCITGRTFCTGSALLVLMADRAPIPTAAKMKGGK